LRASLSSYSTSPTLSSLASPIQTEREPYCSEQMQPQLDDIFAGLEDDGPSFDLLEEADEKQMLRQMEELHEDTESVCSSLYSFEGGGGVEEHTNTSGDDAERPISPPIEEEIPTLQSALMDFGQEGSLIDWMKTTMDEEGDDIDRSPRRRHPRR
jgi:hypothetical protein